MLNYVSGVPGQTVLVLPVFVQDTALLSGSHSYQLQFCQRSGAPTCSLVFEFALIEFKR